MYRIAKTQSNFVRAINLPRELGFIVASNFPRFSRVSRLANGVRLNGQKNYQGGGAGSRCGVRGDPVFQDRQDESAGQRSGDARGDNERAAGHSVDPRPLVQRLSLEPDAVPVVLQHSAVGVVFEESYRGRASVQLNFSVWSTYNDRRKAKKLEEICEQVKSAAMPLPSYLWIHWDSKLRDGDAQALCDWANAEQAKIEAAGNETK